MSSQIEPLTYELIEEGMTNGLENCPEMADWPAEDIMHDMMAYWDVVYGYTEAELLPLIILWKSRHNA